MQEDKVFLCELFTQIQDANTSEGQFQELVCGGGRGSLLQGSLTGVIPAGVIATGVIPAGVIPAGVIAAGVIATGVIVAGVIAAGVIAAGVIATGLIAAGVIAAGVIAAGVIAAGVIAAGVIAAGVIAAGGALTCTHHLSKAFLLREIMVYSLSLELTDRARFYKHLCSFGFMVSIEIMLVREEGWCIAVIDGPWCTADL